VSVAIAAVTCGRLSNAAEVRANRGCYSARADKYGVNVTVTERRSPNSRRVVRQIPENPQVVLEHWGGDAEMLASTRT
jgi:hypothetical protein